MDSGAYSKMCVDKNPPTFNVETIKELLKATFSDPKTKISDDAAIAITEMLRLATIEAALRAGVQAKRDSADCVLIDHIEKILPQFILDI